MVDGKPGDVHLEGRRVHDRHGRPAEGVTGTFTCRKVRSDDGKLTRGRERHLPDLTIGATATRAHWRSLVTCARGSSCQMHAFERREQPAKRVIVIGAGMAGLVAGYELARAGHDPLILEAQNRVGGRVYTLRTFAPGLYAEAGAMRIPRVHDLTLGYIEHFGLRAAAVRDGQPQGPRPRRRAAA